MLQTVLILFAMILPYSFLSFLILPVFQSFYLFVLFFATIFCTCTAQFWYCHFQFLTCLFLVYNNNNNNNLFIYPFLQQRLNYKEWSYKYNPPIYFFSFWSSCSFSLVEKDKYFRASVRVLIRLSHSAIVFNTQFHAIVAQQLWSLMQLIVLGFHVSHWTHFPLLNLHLKLGSWTRLREKLLILFSFCFFENFCLELKTLAQQCAQIFYLGGQLA